MIMSTIETLRWFKAIFPGGDLEIVCKQCGYRDSDYDHYSAQIPPGECPCCGLGRDVWMKFCFEVRNLKLICKKCEASTPGHAVMKLCPHCGHSSETEVVFPCEHEYEYKDIVTGKLITETVERKDMPSYDIYVRYGSWTKVCKKCGYSIKQTGRIRESHFLHDDRLFEPDSD